MLVWQSEFSPVLEIAPEVKTYTAARYGALLCWSGPCAVHGVHHGNTFALMTARELASKFTA